MRRYEELWQRIKKEKNVTIRCRAEKAQTIKQGVKKEKTREVAARKALDLPYAGSLEFSMREVAHEKVLLSFKLVLPNKAFAL